MTIDATEIDLLGTFDEDPRSPSAGNSGAAAAGQRYVTFYLGERLFAVRASAIAEICSPLKITPIPVPTEGLAGLSLLRGDIIAVVDLRSVLGERSQNLSPKQKTLVLRSIESDVETPIAFQIDKVGDIRTLAENEIVRKVELGRYFVGSTTPEAGSIGIIDCSRLASALEAA